MFGNPVKDSLKLWLANITGFLVTNPVVILAAVLLIALLIVVAAFQSCGYDRTERKKEQIGANIKQGEFEANLIQNTLVNQQLNTNRAEANLNAVKNANYGNTTGSDLDKLAEKYK